MKIPIWKKWLSYIREVHVESAPSDINPHLYVSINKGRYQLCTSNAIYSHADLYGNFRKAFESLNWNKVEGKELLILGFGLGSIPFMLENTFNKIFQYTAVELDENVMYLAQKYVLPEIQSKFTFHMRDAEQFIYSTNQKWDLICMDVFIDDKIPKGMQTQDFCRRINECLNPNGVLIYNRLSRNKKDRKATHRFFKEIFQPIFPHASYLDVNGNWMLTNHKENYRLESKLSISTH